MEQDTRSSSLAGESVCNVEFCALPYEHINLGANMLLPDCIAGEFVETKTGSVHNSEVERKEEESKLILAELQEDLDRINSIETEISSCSKAICLARNHVTGSVRQCSKLREEVSLLVCDSQCLKLELIKTGVDQAVREKSYDDCRIMLSEHGLRVKELEKTMALQREVEYFSSHVEKLKTQRIDYMNDDCLKVLQGEKHQEVQNMITVVQASIEKEKKDTHQLEEMVSVRREKIQQLKRELDISNKRHTAQLTRLQRQVTEVQFRQRQFIEELGVISQEIQSLRQKLEE